MIRKQKKSKARRRRGVFFLILLLILILAYIFLFSPLFKIKSIDILGNKEVSEEQIKNYFNYKNIFLFTEAKIKADLVRKIPKIVDIRVKKDIKDIFKRKIKLIIQEREKIGIVCQMDSSSAEAIEDKCFYIDKEGVVFENALQTSGSLILLIKDYSQREFVLGKKLFEENLINNILEIRENLFLETGIKSLDFNILSFPPNDLKVMTNEGWYIIFSLERNINSQITALKAALEEKIQKRENLEYIDLRIENRIYYK